MILLGIAAALACGCFGGNPGGAVQGALTFHEFTDYTQGQTMFAGTAFYGRVDRTGKAGQGYTPPKAALQPLFFTLTPVNQGGGGRPLAPFVGVLGRSNASLDSPDLMWIDWNRDKKFEDDEQAVQVPGADTSAATPSPDANGRTSLFKPTVWPKIGGRTVYMVLQLSGANYVSAMPAGYMGSTVELDGKPLKIGIMDANLNGVFGDVFGTRSSGDILLIDRKGDGKFETPQYTSTASLFEGDEVPLLALTSLNGTFYEIRVSPDGSTVTLTPSTDPSGTLTVTGVKAGGLLVDGPKGMLFAEPVDGKYKLPAASYTVQSVEYKVADPKGADWSFAVGAIAGKKLQVLPDTVKAVEVWASVVRVPQG